METTCVPTNRMVSTPLTFSVAPVAFFLLFPGFFFYQTLIGLGAVTAFLGGYFTVVSIALFFPLARAYYCAVKSAGYRAAPTDVQFGFFLAYFSVIVAINAGFGADTAAVTSDALSILYFFNIYLIFKYSDFSETKTMAMVLISLLVMSAIIFILSEDGSFRPAQSGAAKNLESVATYQGFARSYALTFVAVICFKKLAMARLTLYSIAILALILNGARSELVAVLFLVPMIEVYRAKNGLYALGIVALIFALALIAPPAAMAYFPESRVWELFDLSVSESARSRYNLTQRALQTIAEHPLLGDYASYTPGGYSHNILSAWVDLGAFGFAYMSYMLTQTAVLLFVKGWLVKTRSSQFLLAWSLICMTVVLLLTAKTYNEMLAGAAMGAYANYRFQTRQLSRAPSRNEAYDQ